MRLLDDILLEQRDPQRRLAFARAGLAVAVVRTTWKLAPPASFVEEHADTLLDPSVNPSSVRPMSAAAYDRLRVLVTVSVLLWATGLGGRAIGLVASTLFWRLNRFVALMFPDHWAYNTHLNSFLVVAAAVGAEPAGRGRSARRARTRHRTSSSLAVGLMQFGVGLVYLQAGTSKVRYGARGWLDGSTVRGALAVLGTPASRPVRASRPAQVAVGWATLAIELGFLPALLVCKERGRRFVALVALAFHAGIKRQMDISFWHLWYLYPALFLAPTRLGRGVTPRGR